MKHTVADFLPPPHDIEIELLKDVAEVKVFQYKDEESLIEASKDADALLVWYSIPIPERVINMLSKCKVIVDAGVGFDNIDIKVAGERGIYVCNVPDYCVEEVADHTIGLMLMLIRKFHVYDRAVKNGMWDFRVAAPIFRIKGKVLGIVGLGRIGTAVAIRAKALGLKVVAYDPYLPLGREKSLDVERVEDLKELLQKSDVVTLHVPLTDETFHMIGEKEIMMMKPTSYLINTSRGEVIDRNALTKALENKWIAGAACDVLEGEPPTGSTIDINDPLLKLDNVILTPHSAFFSMESGMELRTKAAMEISRVLKGETPKYAVNMDLLRRS